MRIFRFLTITFFLSRLIVAQSAGPAGPAIAPGLDVQALDKTADPCVNFYQYSCGGWIKSHPVPPDQPSYGRFNELQDRNLDLLRGILENAASARQRTPNEQKIGDYYATCMDEDAINKKGISVLQPVFDRIAAVPTKADLPELVAHLQSHGIGVLFTFGSDSDFKDAQNIIAEVDQGGLSLPDRDYYLKEDPKSVEQRKAYVEYVTNMFKLLGDSPDKAAAEAGTVMAVETALAKGSMDRVSRREPANVYHKMGTQELQALTPSLSWAKYLSGTGAPKFTALNVAVPDFFKALDQEISTASLDDLKTYIRWRTLNSLAGSMPSVFVDENFSFYGKTLRGAKQLLPRWKRCTSGVDGNLGEALGQIYAEKYFPADAKASTLRMVGAIEDAMRRDLDQLPWMSETTKKQALIKLQGVENKIGYPNKWRDYGLLEIKRGDAIGNVLRARAFNVRFDWNKIGTKLDKQEWEMTPPTVNAYYEPTQNNINFPAGILQPPFYDYRADEALNLGGIGAVIGHELTHGFDDQGRQFDVGGNLHDWWTAQDNKAFEERAKCLVDEYNGFVAVDDVHLNGKLTLGENTADNGGLRLAYMALMSDLAKPGRPMESVDGFTPEQRLFLGWGQIWCANMTDQVARLQALTNEHSLGRYRVNGVVQNMPEFQKAWGCKSSQPMVSQNACHVW